MLDDQMALTPYSPSCPTRVRSAAVRSRVIVRNAAPSDWPISPIRDAVLPPELSRTAMEAPDQGLNLRQRPGDVGDLSGEQPETTVIESIAVMDADVSAKPAVPSDSLAPSCVEATADAAQSARDCFRLASGCVSPFAVEVGPGVPQHVGEFVYGRLGRCKVACDRGGITSCQDDRHRCSPSRSGPRSPSRSRVPTMGTQRGAIADEPVAAVRPADRAQPIPSPREPHFVGSPFRLRHQRVLVPQPER